MTVINALVTELANRGWGMTETGCYPYCGLRRIWGTWNEHTVVVTAPYRTQAWRMVVVQVIKVRKDLMQDQLAVLARQIEAAGDAADRLRLVAEMGALNHELELDRVLRREVLR